MIHVNFKNDDSHRGIIITGRKDEVLAEICFVLYNLVEHGGEDPEELISTIKYAFLKGCEEIRKGIGDGEL